MRGIIDRLIEDPFLLFIVLVPTLYLITRDVIGYFQKKKRFLKSQENLIQSERRMDALQKKIKHSRNDLIVSLEKTEKRIQEKLAKQYGMSSKEATRIADNMTKSRRKHKKNSRDQEKK